MRNVWKVAAVLLTGIAWQLTDIPKSNAMALTTALIVAAILYRKQLGELLPFLGAPLWKTKSEGVQAKESGRVALPDSRPKISFVKWGQVENETGAAVFQRGFYLRNHGSEAALEVTVQRFQIDTSVWATSKPIPEIARDTTGFAPVWTEGGFVIVRFELLPAMRAATAAKVDAGQLAYSQTYSIPVSVEYRDFNDFWYRSKANICYIPRQDKIIFEATTQEAIGKRVSSPLT